MVACKFKALKTSLTGCWCVTNSASCHLAFISFWQQNTTVREHLFLNILGLTFKAYISVGCTGCTITGVWTSIFEAGTVTQKSKSAEALRTHVWSFTIITISYITLGKWNNGWETAIIVEVGLNSWECAHFAEGISHTGETILEVTNTIPMIKAISI